MKNTFITILFFAGFIPSWLAYADDCTLDAKTQGEAIACEYSTNFDPLEQKIQKEYELLLTDIGESEVAADEAVGAMVLAQKSWLAYRESTCEFASLKEGGGTVTWGVKYSCLMEFSAARLKTLQRYRKEVAGRPG